MGEKKENVLKESVRWLVFAQVFFQFFSSNFFSGESVRFAKKYTLSRVARNCAGRMNQKYGSYGYEDHSMVYLLKPF